MIIYVVLNKCKLITRFSERLTESECKVNLQSTAVVYPVLHIYVCPIRTLCGSRLESCTLKGLINSIACSFFSPLHAGGCPSTVRGTLRRTATREHPGERREYDKQRKGYKGENTTWYNVMSRWDRNYSSSAGRKNEAGLEGREKETHITTTIICTWCVYRIFLFCLLSAAGVM